MRQQGGDEEFIGGVSYSVGSSRLIASVLLPSPVCVPEERRPTGTVASSARRRTNEIQRGRKESAGSGWLSTAPRLMHHLTFKYPVLSEKA